MLKYFSLKGRRNRAAYILYGFFLHILESFMLKSTLLSNLRVIAESSALSHDYFGLVMVVLLFMLLGVFLFFGVQNKVKRLHDLNTTGWWALFPLLGGIFYSLEIKSLFLSELLFVCVIPSVILFIMCLFMPGTKGKNRFGDDPLEGK